MNSLTFSCRLISQGVAGPVLTELSDKSHIMAQRKVGAYGESTGGDTSFRRTWDPEEYKAKAEAREAKIKEEGKARYEAALAGKKYHRRASTPPDAKETESRKARLDVSSHVGKQMLVPAGAALGKRGKGAGFYCDACDLTFKDNLQLVDHLNSRQHLVAIGQTGEVKRATVEEVRERLEWLKRKKEEEKDAEVVDLGKRLEVRKDQDEKEREEKRAKRREKRRKMKGRDGENEDEPHDVGDGVISARTMVV